MASQMGIRCPSSGTQRAGSTVAPALGQCVATLNPQPVYRMSNRCPEGKNLCKGRPASVQPDMAISHGTKVVQHCNFSACCRASISIGACQSQHLWTLTAWKIQSASREASNCSLPTCGKRLMPSRQMEVGTNTVIQTVTAGMEGILLTA